MLLVTLVPLAADAATIDVQVRDARGRAVRDAVIYALPQGRPQPPARRTAVMDQRNRTFIPHVLAVQTGTAVSFPNSDDVRHHVYSFSPAKQFQLPLYKGTPAEPVVFDKAGVVMLGCNIHDTMSAYIVVVDTPYFEKAGADGQATLRDVDSGRYVVHVWYPEMRDEPQPATVTLSADGAAQLSFSGGRATVMPQHDRGHGRP